MALKDWEGAGDQASSSVDLAASPSVSPWASVSSSVRREMGLIVRPEGLI